MICYVCRQGRGPLCTQCRGKLDDLYYLDRKMRLTMTTVIYHANCPDGFCAAWLFSKVFPDADFFPANYGDPVPDIDRGEVYIVDFSYPRDDLLALAGKVNKVVVLDHHKTAQAELVDLQHPRLEAVFDMAKSGARIAWEWLQKHCPEHPFLHVPHLVDYTEDRDLWRHRLPQTHEINAAIRSYEQDFDIWDDLSTDSLLGLASEGEAILRYRRQRIEEVKARASMDWLDGYTVPIVNCGIKDIQSEVAGELAPDDLFAACWYEMQNGWFSYSLRSRGYFDVSEVAKKFGGGGHKNAAGFEVPELVHG